jgi:hypothetical protein
MLLSTILNKSKKEVLVLNEFNIGKKVCYVFFSLSFSYFMKINKIR